MVSTEYVVLADCHDASNVFSSEMAYFPNSTASIPQDVATVATNAGQTAIWACSTTQALFTTTNTEFTAKLGPKVSDGQYAGTGTNGYDSNNSGFRCWQQFSESYYTYGGETCNMVYKCNHDAAPSSTPTASCSATTQSSTPSSSSGLSTGAVIGISVGVGLGALIAIGAGFLIWYYVRTKRRRNAVELAGDQPASGSPGSPGGLLGMFKKSPAPSDPAQPHSAVSGDATLYQRPVHEMDATGTPVEVSALSPPMELGGRERSEMPTPESQYYMWYPTTGDGVQSPVEGYDRKPEKPPAPV